MFSRTRQTMTNALPVFARWSVCQKLNHVSSVQFNYVALYTLLHDYTALMFKTNGVFSHFVSLTG